MTGILPPTAHGDTAARAPHFAAWLDRFLADYYRLRPVNATFIGVHDFDHLLPDCSEKGLAEKLDSIYTLLAQLTTLPDEPLTPAQEIDRRLAAGFLRIQLWESESAHFARGNPSFYTGEAVFGLMSLLLTDFAPLATRIESLIQRMTAVPRLLEEGRRNISAAPLEWTQRASRECHGAQLFLTEGIAHLLPEIPAQADELRIAASAAAQAFADHQRYLDDELAQRTHDDVACGDAALALLLEQGHCLPMDGDGIVAYAEAELAKAETYLADHAAEFQATSWQDAVARLADLHPTPDGYYARFSELWQASRELVAEQQLLTWPDFPLAYQPRPAWSRAAAPYLYFLFYRAPAVWQRPPVHAYLLTPLDDLTPAEQEQQLRATNDSVIKLNHVVHHGGVGHHVQNWHAYRAASRIGQIAAVDTASRIALYCGGTMAEGWSCYATRLMQEAGFLTPLEAYAEQLARARMAARAVVDVRLHQGRMTLDEATAYYVQHSGMSQSASRAEAVKNSMFPGAAIIYLMGTDMIVDLREELKKRQGDAFALGSFHDNFLAYGSIPVALIRDAMLAEVSSEKESSHVE